MSQTMTESASAKNVARLVKEAIKSYDNARERVQQAGLAIMAHAKVHGDCSQAKILVRGIPANLRNSLIGWFLLFSPIGVKVGDKAADDGCKLVSDKRVYSFRKDQKLKGAENFPLWNIEGAKAHPWYDDPSGKNPPQKPLNTLTDYFGIVERILKKAIRDAKDVDNPKYDPEVADVVVEESEALLNVLDRHKAKRLGGLNKSSFRDDNQRGEEGAGEDSDKIAKPARTSRRNVSTVAA